MSRKRKTKTALKVIERLGELANSQDPAIAVQAVTRLADLELQQSRAESKVGPLKDELNALRKRFSDANEMLEAVTTERDALAAKVAEWRPQIERLPAVEEELAALKRNLESTKGALRAEFVAQAAHERAEAEKALWKAQDMTAEAEARFAREPLSYSVAEWQSRISSQEMPDFWDAASRKHSALFWESWPEFSDTPNKAAVWVVFANRFTNPDAEFRKFAFDVLVASGSQYGTDEPVTVQHLEAKRSFVLAAADRWGIKEELETAANDAKMQRYASWMETTSAMRHASDMQLARLGFGREELQISSTSTGYSGPHLAGCVCGRPGCDSLPARFGRYEEVI
jgi:hypothetical protein